MVRILRSAKTESPPEPTDPIQALPAELPLGTEVDRRMRWRAEHEDLSVVHAALAG